MVEHDVRKLMRLGTSSTALILPKKWLDGLGLRPGSLVDLFFDGSTITVSPRSIPQGQESGRGMQIFIDLREDSVEVGVQEIVAAYVEGVTRVRVKGEEQDISRLITELNDRIAGFIIVSRGRGLYDIVVSEFPINPNQLVSRAISLVNELIAAYSKRDESTVKSLQIEFLKVYNATMRLVRARIAAAPPEETTPLLDILSLMEKMKELTMLLELDGMRMPQVALDDLGELFRVATRSVLENDVRRALKVIQFCRTSICRRHEVHLVNAIVGLAEVAIRKCVRDRACRCKHFFPKVTT